MTNFEKIRGFTDEQFAEYMAMDSDMGHCDFCTHGLCGDGSCDDFRRSLDVNGGKSTIVKGNKYCEEGFVGFLRLEDDGVIDEGLKEYRKGNCVFSKEWWASGDGGTEYSYKLPGY